MTQSEEVRRILAEILRDAGDDALFSDEDSMVVSGRLSSLDVVNIVTALEEAFGFEVRADQFDPILFDSVQSIVEMLGSSAARR